MKVVTKQGQIREVEWDALHQFYVYKDCTHPLQNRICTIDNVKGHLPTNGYPTNNKSISDLPANKYGGVLCSATLCEVMYALKGGGYE